MLFCCQDDQIGPQITVLAPADLAGLPPSIITFCQPGTDVMISKIFSPKNSAKNGVF
jgi:hypothetical protein